MFNCHASEASVILYLISPYIISTQVMKMRQWSALTIDCSLWVATEQDIRLVHVYKFTVERHFSRVTFPLIQLMCTPQAAASLDAKFVWCLWIFLGLSIDKKTTHSINNDFRYIITIFLTFKFVSGCIMLMNTSYFITLTEIFFFLRVRCLSIVYVLINHKAIFNKFPLLYQRWVV